MEETHDRSVSVVLPRRERVRLATIDEIKQTAREHLASEGAPALSLRAIAREMGMTASALYRYFASRDDLLTALVTDGFASLADALEAAYAAAPEDDPGQMWLQVAHAYRQWALDNPEIYTLVFGSPIPGYATPKEVAREEFQRGVAVLFRVMAACVAHGVYELVDVAARLSDPLCAQLAEWAQTEAIPLPPAALELCMVAWTLLHGAISLELFGHLPPPLRGPELFEQLMLDLLRAMGYRRE